MVGWITNGGDGVFWSAEPVLWGAKFLIGFFGHCSVQWTERDANRVVDGIAKAAEELGGCISCLGSLS